MDALQVDGQLPALRRPALLAAFEGWNDAGECASGAIDALGRLTRARPFAGIDPEEFFDFQLARPRVRLVDGGSRTVDWPANRFLSAPLEGHEHDVVLLSGTEPNLRWRAFAQTVLDLARQLGVELIVTLGALQIDLPHTRPTPLTGSASDGELARRLGLRRSTYEGPTGITGVLHHACAAAGLPSVSLWAGIPHYLAGSRYEAGTLALVEAVTGLLHIDVSLESLARDAAIQQDEIASLVADDPELATYITELEERADEHPLSVEDLPAATVSGEELAAEFERYLRDRRGD